MSLSARFFCGEAEGAGRLVPENAAEFFQLQSCNNEIPYYIKYLNR